MATLKERAENASDCRAMSEGGFSLLEIVVTVVVVTVLGGALVSLIRGQGAYYGGQHAAVVAQQNTRAILDLMGAEIRLATGSDLIAAQPDSVALRYDVSRAVVCDSIGPDQAVVFVYDSAAATNLLPGFDGVAISPPGDSTWHYSDGTALAVLASGSSPRTLCVGAGAPPGAPDDRYRRLSGFQAVFPGGAPPRGTLLRFYGRLTFSIVNRAGTYSLRRNSQELAAPFGGIAFSYRYSDGGFAGTPSQSRFADVVEVWVTGHAPGASTVVPKGRRFSMGLALRNGALRR